MDNIINGITVICFSPTHTSRTIAEAVAAGMNGTPGGIAGHAGASQQIRTVDLTLDRSDSPIAVGAGETVVLGAPVYAGRVAPEAVRRLRRIQVAAGASVPAVVTVTYGNRDYEDALPEPSSGSTATALRRCLWPGAVPTHWTWPMPAFSEENVPGN